MIPPDKVAVLTGEARSGTSAWMRSLMLAGVPIAGEQWPRLARLKGGEQQRQEEIERMRRMNRDGFWEVPGTVNRGLKELDGHGGKLLKIVAGGIPPRQGRRGPIGTDPRLVWRYVLALRDPRHVAESQRDLRRSVQIAAQGESWQDLRGPADPVRYLQTVGRLAVWLADRPLEAWLSIDYDETLADPKSHIGRACDHLLYTPSSDQLSAAAAHWDEGLRRSAARFGGWTDEKRLDGETAVIVYQALKEMTPAAVSAAAVAAAERLEAIELEHAQWFSAEVGWMITPSMERKIRQDAEYAATLRRFALRRMQAGYHPEVCRGYEQPPDAPMYTIRRPIDLGDLSVRLCRYRGEWCTREDAFQLHQLAVVQGTAPPLDPQKLAAWHWRW